MRHLIRCTLILVLLLLALPVQAAEDDRGLIWRVEGGAAPAYLVGSVHLAKPSFYPLPCSVSAAFAESDVLVVEANVLAADPSLLRDIRRLGIYPPDESLQAALGEADWKRLSDAAARFGIAPEALLRQRPWMVQMTLAVLALQTHGYRDGLGLDVHFLRSAGSRDMEIRELESLQWQTELLASFPEELQLEMLRLTVQQILDDSIPVDAIETIWRQGDTEHMNALLEQNFPPRLEPVEKAMLDDRNLGMVEKIATWLGEGRRLFVVVGAGHMIGPQGLPELLRKRGYKVERL